MGKKRTDSLGQTLVEYALILPILLLLLVVLFDMGRGIYYYSVVHNAAREGARYGIIFPDDEAGIVAKARQRAVGLDPLNLDIDPKHLNDADGNRINVIVTYNFKPSTPFVEDLLGGPITLTSQSTMNVEG